MKNTFNIEKENENIFNIALKTAQVEAEKKIVERKIAKNEKEAELKRIKQSVLEGTYPYEGKFAELVKKTKLASDLIFAELELNLKLSKTENEAKFKYTTLNPDYYGNIAINRTGKLYTIGERFAFPKYEELCFLENIAIYFINYGTMIKTANNFKLVKRCNRRTDEVIFYLPSFIEKCNENGIEIEEQSTSAHKYDKCTKHIAIARKRIRQP